MMQEIDSLSWQKSRMGKSAVGRGWLGAISRGEAPSVSAMLQHKESKGDNPRNRSSSVIKRRHSLGQQVDLTLATSGEGAKRSKPEQSAESIRAAEIAAASCNRRVVERRREEARRARNVANLRIAKAARSKKSAESGPALAVQRLRRAEEKKRVEHENMVEDLALRQLSSMDALNVIRFLSPRFEEKNTFKRELKSHSDDHERVQQLLAED